jgi:hypothetical protein
MQLHRMERPCCEQRLLVQHMSYPLRCIQLWLAVVRGEHPPALDIAQLEMDSKMAVDGFLVRCHLRAAGLKTPLPDGQVPSKSVNDFALNWLQVLDTAKCSQVDHRVCHHLHRIVSLLDAFKSEQQPLEFILPRKGPLDTHA